MNRKISNLHFITPQPTDSIEFYEKIEFLLSNGIDWLQYRNKQSSDEDFVKIGQKVQAICKEHNTTFIINDRLHLVQQLNADGIHVGQKDKTISEAKKELGSNYIVGNSTNNFQEIETAQNNGANYVGLGPFQFTNTKDNLNPILGLNGFHQIIQNAKGKINIPIVAIGGITMKEIIELKSIGIKHFAISSYLFQMNNKEEIKHLIDEINS